MCSFMSMKPDGLAKTKVTCLKCFPNLEVSQGNTYFDICQNPFYEQIFCPTCSPSAYLSLLPEHSKIKLHCLPSWFVECLIELYYLELDPHHKER